MVKEKFYVSTPIYYPNDIPHLGHAYTTIAADVLARWNTLQNKEVFFLTGTDEHGKKLETVAKDAGKKPKEFIDEIVPKFKDAWKKLNIDYTHFIRTTDKEHESVVSKVLQTVFDNGDIYKGTYEGLYCTSCEAYYTEQDAPDLKCPIHEKPLEKLKEESYFFKLSKYQSFLLDLYEKNPEFISPKTKRKEVINRVKDGLKDLSISRSSFNWGVPLPFDKKHVTYVWFDALLNYYSGTKVKKKYEKFWPADVHLIGKDILWFHTVYWPAMLESANLPLPKKVFAHGWWTVHSKKMGKSAGNAIKIDDLISYAGVDAARYFLLRQTPFGDDGDFSEEVLKEKYNQELANKLGNLVSRTSALVEKYGLKESKKSLVSKKDKTEFKTHMENLEFDKSIQILISLLDKTNEHIQHKKPWETKSQTVLYELSNSIKDITILFSPFIPETSEKIAKVFNFSIDLKTLESPLKITKIKKSPILFEKIKE